MADSQAWIAYDFGKVKTVSNITINEVGAVGNKVTSFKLQYDNNGTWTDMFTGTSIPGTAINVTPIQTQKVRFFITGAQTNNPQIAEVVIR